MFSAFLSPDMTYSSGIFPSLDADLAPPSSHPLHFPADITPNAHGHLNPSTTASYSSVLKKFQTNGSPQVNGSSGVYAGNGSFENGWKNSEGKDELEEAQLAKLRYIIQKAKIRAGHRVLEIGTGWGSFSIEARLSTLLWTVRLAGLTFASIAGGSVDWMHSRNPHSLRSASCSRSGQFFVFEPPLDFSLVPLNRSHPLSYTSFPSSRNESPRLGCQIPSPSISLIIGPFRKYVPLSLVSSPGTSLTRRPELSALLELVRLLRSGREHRDDRGCRKGVHDRIL
jgi:hypothetical protein